MKIIKAHAECFKDMRVFIYDWADDVKDDTTEIRIYGITENSESICIFIPNFHPKLYLELSTKFSWNSTRARLVTSALVARHIFPMAPTDSRLVRRRRLYSPASREYPMIHYAFPNNSHFRFIHIRLDKPISVAGIGQVQLKVHEFNVPVGNQLAAEIGIPVTGWIDIPDDARSPDLPQTLCKHEVVMDYRRMRRSEYDGAVYPKCLSFDLEVYSSRPNAFPNAKLAEDCIFQISCVLWDKPKSAPRKILLTMGNPDSSVVGSDVELVLFQKHEENKLIVKFAEIVLENEIQLITGYNILGFDTPYILQRSALQRVKSSLLRLSMLSGKICEVRENAKNNQMDATTVIYTEGRIWIDLLQLVKRDYKLPNNKLETVGQTFLKVGKDPIDHKQIFQAYLESVLSPDPTNELMSLVSKYCVQDAVLVQRLFDHLFVWYGVIEMANVCCINATSVFYHGLQHKMFCQIYHHCYEKNIVLDNTIHLRDAADEADFEGGYVMDPSVGLHDDVVIMDFQSLYPTTMVAYNIDYTTLVDDKLDIPDEECHVVKWSNHVHCEHTPDFDPRSAKFACEDNFYRFLKTPQGICPSIVSGLMDMRKKTRATIKEIQKKREGMTDPREIQETDDYLSVLESRQLAYKLTANSVYGGMGAQKGKLPFRIGAKCITALGRQNIQLACRHLESRYGATIIYGDTDSAFCQFKHISDTQELHRYAQRIEREMFEEKIFPHPMRLEYEKIYCNFVILTKKRYMSKKYDPKTNSVKDEIDKKGVSLARRDNSRFLRETYERLTRMIFDKKGLDECIVYLIDRVLACFSHVLPQEDFVITKSVKEMSEYKIKELPTDEKKRQARLKELRATEETYRDRALPANAQLAKRMQSRGIRVDNGTRLEFVVVLNGCATKMFDRIEDAEYQKRNSRYVKLDYFYYVESLITQVDNLFEAVFHKDGVMKSIFQVVKNKQKMVKQISGRGIEFVSPVAEAGGGEQGAVVSSSKPASKSPKGAVRPSRKKTHLDLDEIEARFSTPLSS